MIKDSIIIKYNIFIDGDKDVLDSTLIQFKPDVTPLIAFIEEYNRHRCYEKTKSRFQSFSSYMVRVKKGHESTKFMHFYLEEFGVVIDHWTMVMI